VGNMMIAEIIKLSREFEMGRIIDSSKSFRLSHIAGNRFKVFYLRSQQLPHHLVLGDMKNAIQHRNKTQAPSLSWWFSEAYNGQRSTIDISSSGKQKASQRRKSSLTGHAVRYQGAPRKENNIIQNIPFNRSTRSNSKLQISESSPGT
jgi:hypothetical protein